MSSVLPRFLHRALAAFALWRLLLPLAVAGIGAALLLGYLAQRGLLGVDLVLLVLVPFGGAIAFTWAVANHSRGQLSQLHQCQAESLEKQQQWLEQFSQLSPGNFYILVQDPDGHIWFEFMSSAVEAIHEFTVEQVLQDARLLIDAIHPEDAAAYAAAVRTSAATLGTFSLQWRIITPSGLVKWVQGNSQPQRRANGAIAWYGVVIDITERRQTEATLNEREKRYRAILNAIPDLILRMHRDGTYLDVKMTDTFPVLVTPADIGRNMLDLLPEPVARIRLEAMAKVLDTGAMDVFEFPIQIKDEILWEEVRILPLNEDEVVLIIRDLSQQLQIQAALRQSETTLRQAQRIAQVGSWELDLLTSTVTWSEEMLRILGCAPGQFQPSYEQILAMVPPADRDALIQAIKQTIADRTPYCIEHRVQRPDGTQRCVISRGEIIEADHQQGPKLCSTALDITDRKRTEVALQESEARFRQLAETVEEGFFVFETDTGRYSYLNPAILDLTGMPAAPSSDEPPYARGMSHWLNNIHPEDRDRVAAQLQAERQGEPFDAEYRFLHPDGRLLWLRSRAFPLKDETGKMVRIVGTVENITDRKRLEQALQDSEELFRRAFDDAPIGISLVSPTGRYLRVNKCYSNLLEYSQEELLQMHFQDLTHPDDLGADLLGLEQMNRGEIQTFQTEKRYMTKSGIIIPVFLSASFVRDADDTPLYSIGHILDMRERLEVERLKDEFVSIVSHELRTPITAISGSLILLGSGIYNTRPDKAKSMLDIAINNSNRLVRLVNDILSFERLESGKVDLVMEPCQAADLMQQAIESISTLADQSAITLMMTPCPATLYAAPDALVQALTNLLSNAIKFSEPGQTVLLAARAWVEEAVSWPAGQRTSHHLETPDTASTSGDPTTHPPAPTPSACRYILFTVTDQGRGIPPDKRERIFDQFQQVDVSDSRKKGGTGLGLAICKRIVQQHGGEIWVESEVGRGSTFYFTVPLATAPAAGSEEGASACL